MKVVFKHTMKMSVGGKIEKYKAGGPYKARHKAEELLFNSCIDNGFAELHIEEPKPKKKTSKRKSKSKE